MKLVLRFAAILACLVSISACKNPASEVSSTPANPAVSATPAPTWLSSTEGDLRTSPITLIDGEHQESPDIAMDTQGRLWMTWISFPEQQERVLVQQVSHASVSAEVRDGQPLRSALTQWQAEVGTEAIQAVVLGEGKGATGWPHIAASGESIWVVWSEILEGRFQARLAELQAGHVQSIRTISSSPWAAVRPAIAVGFDGVPWVAWEELQDERIVLMARKCSEQNQPFVIDDSGELNQRAVVLPDRDGTAIIAWDHYENNSYDLRLRRVAPQQLQPIQVLTQDTFLDQSPSLRFDPSGQLWIAWHSNRVLKGTVPRAGRGLALAKVTDAGLQLPVAGLTPPLPSLKDKPDQLDAIEFPQLHFDKAGRPVLFARRGQGYVEIQLEKERWTDWLDLSEPGWGGRGRELRAAMDSVGTFHLVGRWLHHVGYSLLQTPPGENVVPVMEATAGLPPGPTEPPSNPMACDGIGPLYRIGLTEGVLQNGSRPAPGEWKRGKARRQKHAWKAARLNKNSGNSHRRTRGERLQRTKPGILPEHSGKSGTDASALLSSPSTLPESPASDREFRLFLGDLHTHTWVSDAAGDPDEVFTRSRDLLKHDFVSLTDHDVSNGNRYAPFEWEYAQLLSNFFNKEGRFATIVAYEWTSPSVSKGGYGHRNVYFPGSSGPLLGVDQEAPDTLRLFELLRGLGAFTIPHHTSWTGTDWEHFDPELQPLVEIVSVHGNSERADGAPIVPRSAAGGSYALDGLLKGYQFGFVGGSDGHGVPWHYGVSRQEDVWTTGLTGVFAPTLSRNAIHQALKQRLTYATSGAPIGLWVEANGSPMGSAITAYGPAFFRIRVQAMAPLASVELLRDGYPIPRFGLRSIDGFAEGMWKESESMLQSGAGEHFYYLRVIRKDGAMAWTSPIRITAARNRPAAGEEWKK